MTVQARNSTALLLIDPLNDFIAEGGKLWPYAREVAESVGLLPHLRQLQAAARELEIPIFFVPHRRFETNDFEGFKFLNPTHAGAHRIQPFLRGSWGADYHADFQPRSGDIVVHEHWLHNGFANTDLDFQLRIRDLDHLIIAGMRANACVEATARYGVELGYHVTLVKDATAAFKLTEWAATIEVNSGTYAHAVEDTRTVLARLRAERSVAGSAGRRAS